MSAHGLQGQRLRLWSPAGVVGEPAALTRAVARLKALGLAVEVDPAARARQQRFAGDDATRLAALHRTADAAPDIAMAVRGGYGLTRLLDGIDWARVKHSVEQGTRWVGHSDLTALQLGLLAHTGAPSWAGPMALDDFGRAADDATVPGGTDEVTVGTFVEAMGGELEAVGFRCPAGFDGLSVRGTLWGGNLTMVLSLLGTPHWPRRAARGGILFLEDVGEHPYRVERMLLQLHQAGVLQTQKAVLLGAFSGWKAGPLDRGYRLATAFERVREVGNVPLVTGLPFGHVHPKLSLPVGRRVTLEVAGRDVFIVW
jgi:muramoyltetrapeptide carboxypeptidase